MPNARSPKGSKEARGVVSNAGRKFDAAAKKSNRTRLFPQL